MTTQAQQIKELKQRERLVREYWFPWPGHPASDLCGVSVHTLDGEQWAIRAEYGFGPMFVWDGDRWAHLQQVGRAGAYRWTRDQALKLGPKLAAEEAATHPVVEPATPTEVADEIQALIDLSRSVLPLTEAVA